jgi:DNA-binding NtrC family response regulator
MMSRILVVDDDPDVCKSIQASLENRGHIVDSAQFVKHGITALVKIKDAPEHETYAVSIIDLRFENFEGSEEEKDRAGLLVVDAAIKVPFLEAIVLTAYPSPITAAESLSQGVFRYITKNEEFVRRLAEAVELAIENREVMRTLDECLRELSRSLAALKPRNGPIADEAGNYLRWATEAYQRILKARGRHP